MKPIDNYSNPKILLDKELLKKVIEILACEIRKSTYLIGTIFKYFDHLND